MSLLALPVVLLWSCCCPVVVDDAVDSVVVAEADDAQIWRRFEDERSP